MDGVLRDWWPSAIRGWGGRWRCGLAQDDVVAMGDFST